MKAARWHEIAVEGGLPIRLPVATLTERALAFAIDLAIIGVVMGIVGPFLNLMLDTFALTIVLGFVVRWAYFIAFELWLGGATPGKWAMRLRVLASDGRALEPEAIGVRGLIREFEFFLPLVALIAPEVFSAQGPVWLQLVAAGWAALFIVVPMVTPRRQRVGDLLAGTWVVRLPAAQLRADVAARSAGHWRFSSAQLSIYGEHELETLAGILRRLDSGSLVASELVGVVRTIAHKIGWPEQHALADPATFLRELYRAQRAFLERRLLFGRRKASKHDAGGPASARDRHGPKS